jgi:hypothetical protein
MSIRLDAALSGRLSPQPAKPTKTPVVSAEAQPAKTPTATAESAARPIGYRPGPNTLLRPLGYQGGSTNM